MDLTYAKKLVPLPVKLLVHGFFLRTVSVLKVLITLIGAVSLSIVPSQFDSRMLAALHSLFVWTHRRKVTRIKSRLKLILSETDRKPALTDTELLELAEDVLRVRLETRWSQIQAISLRRYSPDVIVEGFEWLKQAQLKGRGVILWRMSFSNPAAMNFALFSKGVELTHLSVRGHLSNHKGWFAHCVDGPIHTWDEKRFLASRVVMEQGAISGYWKQLKSELLSHGVVSITGDIRTGRVRDVHSIGGLTYQIPSGASSLAFSCGAPLVPAAVVRIGELKYKLILFEPIFTPTDSSVTKSGFRKHALAKYVEARAKVTLEHTSSDNHL